MLTHALIRFKLIREAGARTRIQPLFLERDSGPLLASAEEMISVYRAAVSSGEGSLSRADLDQALLPIIASYRASNVLKGFKKLLDVRAVFSSAEKSDFTAMRLALFTEAARAMKHNSVDDSSDDSDDSIKAYRARVRDATHQVFDKTRATNEVDLFLNDCFGDLPDRDRLTAFDTIGPRELIRNYNIATVQTLLLYAKSMTLSFCDPNLAICRQVFAYLKFCRLLATVTSDEVNGVTHFHVTIDGPLSLFEGSKKYGLALATFFPIVPALTQFSLRADVRLPARKTYALCLDQTAMLESTYTRFSTYIPDAVQAFRKSVIDAYPDWYVEEEISILTQKDVSFDRSNAKVHEILTPDLSLVFSGNPGDGEKRVYVELFHRFHVGALRRRLAQMPVPKNGATYVLGVDRALAKRKEIARLLKQSAHFNRLGFLFSEVPRAEQLAPFLSLDLTR